MISKSAPRPVIAPPTPAAKYSPPCAVSHLPAACESSLNLVVKISWYSGESISVLAFRPKRIASSPVWVVWIIYNFGLRPIIQAGSKELANSDFVCLGGILTINLLSLPSAISLNFFATIL